MTVVDHQSHYLDAMGITAWRARIADKEASTQDLIQIFQLINAKGRVCGAVIAQYSNAPTQRQAQQQLLEAICLALGTRVQRSEHIDVNAPVVVVLGDQADAWLQAQKLNASRQILRSCSLMQLLADPRQKAPLWRALKPLIPVMEQY